MRSAAELLDELTAVDESTRIEAKRTSDIGKSVMQTVIAFANEPGLEGGYPLLAVEWHVNDKGDTVYRAAGLLDPNKVQRDLASQCASMPNVPLRPEMKLETVDGCIVLVVFVPEAEVIREALANAAMHRNCLMHGPTQIIRFGNRIEVRNVGRSVKAPAQLDQPGSRPRNPSLAAVLHDLHWAEAKGTGIRAMRRLAAEAGLPPPEIHSDRQANEFKLTLFLHHLLTEKDYRWIKALGAEPLSAHEAKALIYARETGAVDNSACRDFCGLDTLAASLVLRRLRDRGLLEKEGPGSRTHYVLSAGPHPSRRAVQPDLPDLVPEPANALPPGQEGCKPTLQGCIPELATLPPGLATLMDQQQGRSSQAALRELIVPLAAAQRRAAGHLAGQGPPLPAQQAFDPDGARRPALAALPALLHKWLDRARPARG